ncbi:MAG: glycoside hydrolase [Ruminococcus sp.]|nr:glycoside hydrolase [Ruminococcus sp.]
MKKFAPVLAAVMVMASALSSPLGSVSAEGSYSMNVKVDIGGSTKEISPYIYGVNQYTTQDTLKNVTTHSIRQGGNRMTAYNWETNASNAGSDWQHSSDTNLSTSEDPADCVQDLSKIAEKNNIDYKLTTLQLAGYVSADKNGPVSEAEAAPSKRWNKVVLTKGSAFADTPDLTDGVVYMDEYVNYIINKLGDSKSKTGMQAYSLDNEPVLWNHTHSRIHPNPVSIEELRDKSVEMAKAVKKLDPNAEIFGPALYGYTAYDHLADDDSSNEWETLKAQNGYHWYLDCYLDQMKQASDEAGVRLLDVLDIHYYSESVKSGKPDDILQSVRTLYEKGFKEDSWIGMWCQENIPILPTIQNSIDKYYPGTKLAITEYDFGGNNLCGAIAQAEALGCYADAEVYYATLWGGNPYQLSAINLYTNYDGKGGSFGNELVPAKTDDVSLSSSYAAINNGDKSEITVMVTNKDQEKSEKALISLDNSDKEYKAAAVYAIYGDSADIKLLDVNYNVKNNKVEVELPSLATAMVVVSDDASDFKDLKPFDPDSVQKKVVTINNPSVNKNGFVEIPIEDPEHLKEIKLTANVTSSAGSGWATAGCAVSINAKDKNGTGFWTSKSYTLGLGTGQTATIAFDGTFKNDEEDVEGVIADGKVELQQWWSASEKQEADIDDVISADYTKIEVVYEYTSNVSSVRGDVNADGTFSIADIIMMQKWLICAGNITDIKAGDLSEDGSINVFDLSIMKQELAAK